MLIGLEEEIRPFRCYRAQPPKLSRALPLRTRDGMSGGGSAACKDSVQASGEPGQSFGLLEAEEEEQMGMAHTKCSLVAPSALAQGGVSGQAGKPALMARKSSSV
ncbi:hypothetical protein E2562_001033 [Oryza meyeriana var. granulata]|uniref:Uncharacterized protein n=1 Tax=Oryza meyeriana var. granulata TaxID=110450 RepID=A0A6G1EDW1_9ORYZ|nr:hypothetical protein E2562_001033 [Oryza meyeriana var. granulata]